MAPEYPELRIEFQPSEAGWISFGVAPLTGAHPVSATHLEDPFYGLIRWLDAIVEGAACARWCIDEEGSAAQFVFAGENDSMLGRVTAQLIFTRGNEFGKNFDIVTCPVDRMELVRRFYRAFCDYTEGPDYDPDEWEYRFVPAEPEKWAPLARDDGEPPDNAWPWSGNALRTLRSPLVEEELERWHIRASGLKPQP